MTKKRSAAEIIREAAGMKPDQIIDAQALDLHTRYMRAAGRSEDTIAARRGTIQRLADFLDPHCENRRAILDATSHQLVEWQASRGHLATKTVAVYIGHIQVYYKWLVRPMRILLESPAEDLLVPTVKRRHPRPIPEDLLRFALDGCTDRRVRTWIVLGSYAGLRGIDMSLLDTDDVLTDLPEQPRLRVRGKGGYEDVIDIGHEVVRVLDPYRLGRRRGAMFVDEHGKRLSASAIYTAVNDYFDDMGLELYTCHQLRHRYGTRLYLITRDIRYVQRQLRHRTVASTEIYAQVPTDKATKSMQALDAELAERPRLRGAHERQEVSLQSIHALDVELAERPDPVAEESSVELMPAIVGQSTDQHTTAALGPTTLPPLPVFTG